MSNGVRVRSRRPPRTPMTSDSAFLAMKAEKYIMHVVILFFTTTEQPYQLAVRTVLHDDDGRDYCQARVGTFPRLCGMRLQSCHTATIFRHQFVLAISLWLSSGLSERRVTDGIRIRIQQLSTSLTILFSTTNLFLSSRPTMYCLALCLLSLASYPFTKILVDRMGLRAGCPCIASRRVWPLRAILQPIEIT